MTKKYSFYVSPEGSDVNGNGSYAKPFKTIETAQEAVRLTAEKISSKKAGKSRAQTSGAVTGITVYLREGTYCINKTLEFTSVDTSKGAVKVTYRNYKNERPVITSNIAIEGFTEYKDGIYMASLPADKSGKHPEFRDLYVSGKRAVLARTGRKDDYLYFPATYDDEGMFINPGILESIPENELKPVELCLNVEWMSRRFRIKSYKTVENGTIKVFAEEYDWMIFKDSITKRPLLNCPYWFENHLSLLDEPGEWFYDQKTGTVYYYPMPDEDVNKILIEYPALGILVQLNGTVPDPVADLTFEGIGFTGVTNNYTTSHGYVGMLFNNVWQPNKPNNYLHSLYRQPAAFYGSYVNNVTIKRCSFFELGTSAIFLKEGCSHILIEGNAITDNGMSGIEVGDTFVTAQESSWCDNIRIISNYIEKIGTDYRGAVGIFVTRVRFLEISNNHLKHLPYSGIDVGYGFTKGINFAPVYENRIINNYVEDVMYALNDGGPIYTTGYLKEAFSWTNMITGNYVKSNASSIKGCRGIYHDGSSCDWITMNNVIDGFLTYPVFLQYHVSVQLASHIEVRGNYSTISPIKADYPNAAERELIVTDNKFFPTRADLPAEAKEIIEKAGLLPEYKNIIPEKEVVVIMDIASPHQTLTAGDKTEIVFSISNNSGKNATFVLYPYYKSTAKTQSGTNIVQVCGTPDSIKLQPEENKTRDAGTDPETRYPMITVKAGEKNVMLIAALQIKETANIEAQDSYMFDFKLVSDTGDIFSFPRTVNLSLKKQ